MPYVIHAECPQCGKKAEGIEELERLFGFRVIQQKKIPQSWCRDCRFDDWPKKE